MTAAKSKWEKNLVLNLGQKMEKQSIWNESHSNQTLPYICTGAENLWRPMTVKYCENAIYPADLLCTVRCNSLMNDSSLIKPGNTKQPPQIKKWNYRVSRVALQGGLQVVLQDACLSWRFIHPKVWDMSCLQSFNTPHLLSNPALEGGVYLWRSR